MKPKLFLGSSSEGLGIAYALQENLEPDAEVTVWTQGIFEPSQFVLEALLTTLQSSDLGVFVFSPDDVATIRGTDTPVVRDNVLFELGLFVGRLGRQRSVFLVPKGSNLHIPSDLHGVTALSFDANRSDGSLNAALGPAANKIRNTLKKINASNTSETESAAETPSEWTLPWFERRVVLSPTQQKLLSLIEDLQPIAGIQLRERLGGSDSELFYRMEQLRLLGFATRTGDEHAFVYRLSDSYGKAYSAIRRQNPVRLR